MPEPTPRDELLTGRNEATPLRILSRVAVVVFAVVAVVGGLVYGIWTSLN